MSETKEYKIRVTKEDIMAGEPKNCSHCPVALAIKRATGCDRVATDGADVALRFPRGRKTWNAELPNAVTDWIDRFDECLSRNDQEGKKGIEPIEFDLKIRQGRVPYGIGA